MSGRLVSYRYLRVALIAATAGSIAACGAAPGRFGGRLGEIKFEAFEAADTDHDGKLSRLETAAAFPEHGHYFKNLDSDASGYLSWQEVKLGRLPQPMPPRMPGPP